MLRTSASVVLISGLWTASSIAAPAALPQVGLGSSLEAFKGRFGTPVRVLDGLVDFRKCPGKTALAEWTVGFDHGKAVSITRKACPPASLDDRSAKTEARIFFADDAKAIKAFNTTDGWPAQQYHSAALSRAFPASAFRGCKRQVDAPGTFSYLISPERKSWMMALGTCL